TSATPATSRWCCTPSTAHPSTLPAPYSPPGKRLTPPKPPVRTNRPGPDRHRHRHERPTRDVDDAPPSPDQKEIRLPLGGFHGQQLTPVGRVPRAHHFPPHFPRRPLL